MVAAAFGIVAVSMGLICNCFALLVVPVCNEMGFSRSQMSMNQTILACGMMLVSFLWGPLFSRFRISLTMKIAACVTCAAYFFYSVARSILVFYAVSVVLSVSTALIAWPPLTQVIGNWFREKRGTALGIAFMGSGAGGMLFNLIGGILLDRIGWRGMVRVYSLVNAAVLIPLVFFVLRTDPKQMGLAPYGAAEDRPEREGKGLTLRQVIRTGSFPLLALCLLFIGCSMNCCNVVLTPHLQTLGYSGVFSASVAAAFMAAMGLSKILLGALYDRLGCGKGTAIAMGALLTAIICYALAGHRALIPPAVICGGMGTAFGTVGYPMVVRSLYGDRDQASVSAVFNATGSVGGSIGPTLFGMVCDRTGSYVPAYTVLAGILALAGSCFLITVLRILRRRTYA